MTRPLRDVTTLIGAVEAQLREIPFTAGQWPPGVHCLEGVTLHESDPGARSWGIGMRLVGERLELVAIEKPTPVLLSAAPAEIRAAAIEHLPALLERVKEHRSMAEVAA